MADDAPYEVPKDASEDEELRTMAMTLARDRLAARLGQQYGGDRDLYEALGYKTFFTLQDYWNKYERQDIARRVIVEPVNATWREAPTIGEARSDDEKTAFDREVAEIFRRKRLIHFLSRADRLAGIGEYAILLLGFNDGKPMDRPVGSPTRLLYASPFRQENAEVHSWVKNPRDPRYGLPLTYRIELGKDTNDATFPTFTKIVHHTRVVHVPSDGLDESDVYGTPRLKEVYNRLDDLEKVLGGSAEMFWRGAHPGYAFKAEKDAEITDPDKLDDEIERYTHKLQRYLRIQGIDVQELRPQVADPSPHVDALVDAIAAAKSIPRRRLLGSERGELASGQDETNFNAMVQERRANHAEAFLRDLVDKLVNADLVSEPEGEYQVEWPKVSDVSPTDQAQVARDTAQAIASYVNAVGAPKVVPLEVFLREVVGFGDETIEEVKEHLGDLDAIELGNEESQSATGSRDGAAASQDEEADVARS